MVRFHAGLYHEYIYLVLLSLSCTGSNDEACEVYYSWRGEVNALFLYKFREAGKRGQQNIRAGQNGATKLLLIYLVAALPTESRFSSFSPQLREA